MHALIGAPALNVYGSAYASLAKARSVIAMLAGFYMAPLFTEPLLDLIMEGRCVPVFATMLHHKDLAIFVQDDCAGNCTDSK